MVEHLLAEVAGRFLVRRPPSGMPQLGQLVTAPLLGVGAPRVETAALREGQRVGRGPGDRGEPLPALVLLWDGGEEAFGVRVRRVVVDVPDPPLLCHPARVE